MKKSQKARAIEYQYGYLPDVNVSRDVLVTGRVQ
jgi:hypothetical protein